MCGRLLDTCVRFFNKGVGWVRCEYDMCNWKPFRQMEPMHIIFKKGSEKGDWVYVWVACFE